MGRPFSPFGHSMKSTNTYIAIIDDDEGMRDSLGRVLRLIGFQALTFSSAELFLADPVREHFACLLVDMQLGGMSGIDLLKKLVAAGDHAPVIFITADDSEYTRSKAREIGCAGYFRKGESSEEIVETVKMIVSGRAPKNNFTKLG